MIEVLSSPPVADGQNLDIWGAPIPQGVVFGRDPVRTRFQGAEGARCFLNDRIGPKIVANVGHDCFILGYRRRTTGRRRRSR